MGTHDGGIFAVDNISKLPAISLVYVILHMTTAAEISYCSVVYSTEIDVSHDSCKQIQMGLRTRCLLYRLIY